MVFLPPGVDGASALLLIVASFFTSALTASFGIGGGVAMLGALAGTVSPGVIIAVHGIVQLGSNLGRAVLQRAHAVWPMIGKFVAGSVVGVAIGAWLLVAMPERALLGLLGAFILLIVWVPKPRLPGLDTGGLVAAGLISSILTMFLGATGVFTKSLLLAYGLERRALIATDAVMMTAQHLLKVIAFGFIGFALVSWLPLVSAMIVSGFIGTVMGTRLLEKLPERLFRVILKTLLSLIALDLLRRAAGIGFPGF